MGLPDDEARARIDGLLREWRQGDCVVGEQWFLFRIDPTAPLTEEAEIAADDGADAAEAAVRGLVVVTQTCDIVRGCAERPFVEVCPLVEVDEALMSQIERGGRPGYALVPGVAADHLVADLDRVMTVEKAVLAQWERTPGTHEDDDVRRLARALARKRARFAFPDDFVRLVGKLRDRILAKHEKQSEEGEALRGLREIRVRADPSWDADKVEVMLWFIRAEDDSTLVGTKAERLLERWLDLVPSGGRFHVDGVIQTLDDLTARDYVESDPLDLDHLSGGES